MVEYRQRLREGSINNGLTETTVQFKTKRERWVRVMASKNKNPYREGCAYNQIFAFIRKNQVVTKNQLVEAGFSVSDITVVLSPRAEGISTRGGDCRGNLSARGEYYFMDKISKKEVGEAQRFRLRYRVTPLEKATRHLKKEVVAVKETPVQTAEVVEPVVVE